MVERARDETCKLLPPLSSDPFEFRPPFSPLAFGKIAALRARSADGGRKGLNRAGKRRKGRVPFEIVSSGTIRGDGDGDVTPPGCARDQEGVRALSEAQIMQ